MKVKGSHLHQRASEYRDIVTGRARMRNEVEVEVRDARKLACVGDLR